MLEEEHLMECRGSFDCLHQSLRATVALHPEDAVVFTSGLPEHTIGPIQANVAIPPQTTSVLLPLSEV
jgi:hypothetical protein